MGEVIRIALVILAVVLTVIFTFDMVFYCWFKRKREYWNHVASSLAKGLKALSDEIKSDHGSQEKQSL